MGRYIKNAELSSRSYAIRIPVGNNVVAPQSPVDGLMRFNTSTGTMEVYFNGSWRGAGTIGTVAIVKDTFVGDGARTLFTISNSYLAGHEAEMLIYIDGVFQNPSISYTVSGYSLTFTSAPNPGVSIVVLHNFNSTKVQ